MCDKYKVIQSGAIFQALLPAPKNWNQYISLERGNKYAAAHYKRHEAHTIEDICAGHKYDGGYPAKVLVKAGFKAQRGDLDNVRIKGYLDGLVKAGVIVDDSVKYIGVIHLKAVKGEPLLELLIEPI